MANDVNVKADGVGSGIEMSKPPLPPTVPFPGTSNCGPYVPISERISPDALIGSFVRPHGGVLGSGGSFDKVENTTFCIGIQGMVGVS